MSLLQVSGLTCRFGGLVAVNDVSLTVEPRAIHGLIGPNGAGKTTTFNLISGVLKPTAGRVAFDGADITGVPMHRLVKRGLVRTFQHSQLFPGFTVFRNVLLALHSHTGFGALGGFLGSAAERRKRAELAEEAQRILDFVGLADHAQDLAGDLPHGFQRLLQVAVGLAPKPRLLLLDEPVAGLNHADVDRMMALVRDLRDKQDVTIVLVEHNMKAVMGVCDRVSVLQFGRLIAEGTAQEVTRNPTVIEAYLGVYEDAS
ncbi:MAG TPA: ABC transporter ATP-binding protein [Rhodopila sp.]|uniref:ABC transporter ATP-binding protein n=1 Tax=Rhodopila sp. TaxID=2480087 RepID=UPI002CEF63D0|nr:ABC transporter ATP-binding protein [Rhodopila sp.]HVY14325.1 ABC transporter ATP-binding protein [Rhodopila sp.]